MFRSSIFVDPVIQRDLHKEKYDHILTSPVSQWSGDQEYLLAFRQVVGDDHYEFFVMHNLVPEHQSDPAQVGGTLLASGPSIRPVFEFETTPDPKPWPKPPGPAIPAELAVRLAGMDQKLDALLRLQGVDIL